MNYLTSDKLVTKYPTRYQISGKNSGGMVKLKSDMWYDGMLPDVRGDRISN